jgi:hypothetical protein
MTFKANKKRFLPVYNNELPYVFPVIFIVHSKTAHIMKATNLRLGNVVALFDQPENPDRVLILEPGLVHLMNRDEADDEKNIIGVPVSEQVLAQYQIPFNCWHKSGTTKIYIDILQDPERATLHCQGIKCNVLFLHEIQNLVFDLTGEDLIKHHHIHYA